MHSLDFTRPQVMGIVNITPDSFYDGGSFLDADRAYAHIKELAANGADIIDVGAESTRPGFQPISCAEEMRRLAPLFTLLRQSPNIPLSIDTSKPEIAAEAIKAGFTIINNTGRELPRKMAELAADSGAYLVHMFWGPFEGEDVAAKLKSFFNRRIKQSLNCGVRRDRLILDPGIGFDMEPVDCVAIMRNLDRLRSFSLPILVGLSNKRFIGAVSGAPLAQRLSANIAAELCAVASGVSILRVHNVEASVYALRM
ncbi:MAG: dihydropteroate synthase, partial [Clostridia bacterium]|nr:dihydropteroate synthase [Clostridia bacterium]